MSKLVDNLSWLVAGVALYHLGRMLLNQRDERLLAKCGRLYAERQAKTRRLYRLATNCQLGFLNN